MVDIIDFGSTVFSLGLWLILRNRSGAVFYDSIEYFVRASHDLLGPCFEGVVDGINGILGHGIHFLKDPGDVEISQSKGRNQLVDCGWPMKAINA